MATQGRVSIPLVHQTAHAIQAPIGSPINFQSVSAIYKSYTTVSLLIGYYVVRRFNRGDFAVTEFNNERPVHIKLNLFNKVVSQIMIK